MAKKFNVGDKVRILDASKIMGGFSRWKNGEITEVVSFMWGYPQLRINHGRHAGLRFVVTTDEFKYIEKVAEHVTKKQRITTLEQQVAELQAEVATLKQASKPSVFASAEFIAKLSERSPRKKMSLTPNELRKAIIAEAKAFYSDILNEYQFSDGEVVVIGNDKERSISVTIRHLFSLKPLLSGKSKCAPDDVFNADIGKAIALGRALGLDVERFEQAVKPTEVVVGQIIRNTGSAGGTRACTEVDGNHIYRGGCYITKNYAVITDDTDAQY